MSPEYAMHGNFSNKSDVYSFGVLVLEIVSGKRNNTFYQSGDTDDLLCFVSPSALCRFILIIYIWNVKEIIDLTLMLKSCLVHLKKIVISKINLISKNKYSISKNQLQSIKIGQSVKISLNHSVIIYN